jgi:hypothetical protein
VESKKKYEILIPQRNEVYSIQHYVIKFVSDLPQVSGFFRVLRFPPQQYFSYIVARGEGGNSDGLDLKMLPCNGLSTTTYRVRVMVLNATLNNFSVISWRSVLLVEETGVHGKNH